MATKGTHDKKKHHEVVDGNTPKKTTKSTKPVRCAEQDSIKILLLDALNIAYAIVKSLLLTRKHIF